MIKKKVTLNENIGRIKSMFNYDVSKTLTEQKTEKGINKRMVVKEQSLMAAGALALSAVMPISAAILMYKASKAWIAAVGNDKFKQAFGNVNGSFLMEQPGFKQDGVDKLGEGQVIAIAGVFYQAGEAIRTGTNEEMMYKAVAACKTMLGASQVSEMYMQKRGEDLAATIVDEMKDDMSELNKVFRMASRLPLCSYKGEMVKDQATLEEIMKGEGDAAAEEEKKTATETRKGFDPDFTLVKVDGQDLPFDYELEGKALELFNKFLEKGYGEKWTPEYLAANAISRTWDKFEEDEDGNVIPVDVSYPGDGKIVKQEVEQQSLDDITLGESVQPWQKRLKNLLYEGSVTNDGKGNIKVNKDDVSADADDGGDTKDDAGTGTKKATWRKEPTEAPTEENKLVIKVGMKGDKVKQIQKVIGAKEDGYFGKNTKKAVEAWQKEQGLSVDGVVGPTSWAKISGGAEGTEGGEGEGETAAEQEAGEVTGTTEEGTEVDQMTDEEMSAFVEEQKGDKLPFKACRKMMISTSRIIKKRPAEIGDLQADEKLKLTLGNCFNDHNFPIILGHTKRVKKTFGLKGKGNV